MWSRSKAILVLGFRLGITPCNIMPSPVIALQMGCSLLLTINLFCKVLVFFYNRTKCLVQIKNLKSMCFSFADLPRGASKTKVQKEFEQNTSDLSLAACKA